MHQFIQALFVSLDNTPPGMALALAGLLMCLESMCVPIPSEMVLPMAGMWAAHGKFGPGWIGIIVVLIAVTVGCLAGSSIAYVVGYYGGEPLVERFGKYILITPHRLQMAERWLDKFGPWAIFLGRLTTGVRALISFPVGILRLPYRRFFISTLAGGFTWNVLGVSLGYFFGDKVRTVLHEMSLSMFVFLAVVAFVAVAFYFYKTHIAVGKNSASHPAK